MPLDELLDSIQPEQLQEPEAQDSQETDEGLPEHIQTALKDLIRHFAGEDKFVRRTEVIEARRQRFYWRNDQYIYWNNSSLMFAPISSPDTDSTDMPAYQDVYNIYQPFGRGIISVLCQNPPGINFEPNDPMNAADITAAQTAEKYRHYIDRQNDSKKLQQDISRLFWTDGRVVLHTRTEVSDDKQYECTKAYGVLETKLPALAKDQSEFPYLIISDELDVNVAKDRYPDAAENIREGSSTMGESSYERMARLGVLQGTRLLMQSGDAFNHMITRHQAYFRPAAFEKASDNAKDELKEMFPEGCYVVVCGDAYCESANGSMDDHIVVGHPIPGDGQNRPSMGKAMVPIQDAFNDLMNERREVYDYCIPVTWMLSELGDIEALREQISEPGNHVPVNLPANIMDLSSAIYQEPPAQVSADMVEAINYLSGALPQFVTGALPALIGGEMENNDTAKGYAMARDQAMGQLGLPWGAMQEMYAKAYKQGVMCAARDRDAAQTIHLQLPSQNGHGQAAVEDITIADLQRGLFHCYPNQDSSFPETFAAKRNTFMQLFSAAGKNPVLMQTFMQPDNLELTHELLGLEDLVIPGADSRNKQLKEIELLLKQNPVPPSPEEMQAAQQQYEQNSLKFQLAAAHAQQSGLPPPPPPPKPDPQAMMKPSIPIDPDFDFHQFEFQEVQRWLSSDEGQKARQTNPQGLQNVRLHGLAHQQIMQSQQAQQAQQNPPPQKGAKK